MTRSKSHAALILGTSLCFSAGITCSQVVTAQSRPAYLTTTSNATALHSSGLAAYAALRARYDSLPTDQRSQIAQTLSAMDVTFGRYDDARRHVNESLPPKALTCPAAPFAEKPLSVSVDLLAHRSRLLLINEYHAKPQTRAAIIGLLPTLRHAGYTDLAMEALNPEGPAARKATGVTRADLRDDTSSGYYLRDPVEAKLIEISQALGFGLVAYEGGDFSHVESRETAQAANLKRWLDTHPGRRLVVIAGHDHIFKSDGWMAQRLQASLRERFLSIDQAQGVEGCTGQPVATLPTLWMTDAAKAWSAHPERVDATATWHTNDTRGAPDTWLTLGGIRKAVLIADACQGARPCLVEARATDSPGSVPEDRLATFGAAEPTTLYLAPGTYQLSEETTATTTHSEIEVSGWLTQ